LAYITPPINYPQNRIADIEKYIDQYMVGLTKAGYLKQFFNIEFFCTT
jgi:hypothetical protein